MPSANRRDRTRSPALVCVAAIAALTGGLAASPAAAKFDNQKPIWSQVDVLICRGTHRQVCAEELCFKKTSKAEWRIDFKQKKIFKSGLPGLDAENLFAEDIVATDFAFYGDERGSRHVLFFGGVLMDFDMDNASAAGGEAVSARTLQYTWRKPLGFEWEDSDTSVETRFGCAAQGAPTEFTPNR